MSVLDYLHGFTQSDTAAPPPIDPYRYSVMQQYPGAGQFSGFSLTGAAAPPYGNPAAPSLMTPEQQAFAKGPVPQGMPASAAAQQAPPSGGGLGDLTGLIGSGFSAGQAVGQAAAGPSVEQQVFTKHFGTQTGQTPMEIQSMPPELAQFLNTLFTNGGFQ